jgi:hypothetical protein
MPLRPASWDRMTKEEFFAWCDRQGLKTNPAIANAIGVSSQTIRNWREAPGIPGWVRYATIWWESAKHDPAKRVATEMTAQEFIEWQSRNKFDTYQSVGDVLLLTRQAVHNWIRRKRFPRYVRIACAGYEITTKTATA